MFCPVCKAEYRQGFTRCADCGVELVHELPAAAIVRHEAVAPGDSEEDPFCSFWTGDDPRIQAELCALLENEKIPYKTLRREDHLFNISNYAAFQIGIPFSMFERAEAVVKEAYGSEEAIQPASRLLPEDSDHMPGARMDPNFFDSAARLAWQRSPGPQEQSIDESREAANRRGRASVWNSEEDREDGNLAEASAEIWSGMERETAEFILASLQINQIQCRQEQAGRRYALYVLPEDETRAKEIVREVVEGVPPE